MNRADVNLDQVGQFIFDLYGLSSIEINRLNGYDDKNFHVLVKRDINSNSFIDTVSDDGYVLKIINTLDSQQGDRFDAQKQLLCHLNQRGILCPKPIINKQGNIYEKITLSTGVHILWLLQYIDGIILHKVPKSSDLFYHVGALAANIDNALKSFDHPVYHNRIQWSLGSAADVIDCLSAISGDEKKDLIRRIISEFSARVLSVESELERGIIHGDLNEQNIIVDNENLKIKAVIDFGDTHYGCYLYELALAIVYMIFTSNDVKTGRYVVNGYHSVRPIPVKEFKLLKVCVLARYCQSLVYGAYGSLQDPTNDYILTTSKSGWNLLKTIYDFPEDDLLNLWGTDIEFRL
ncbi:hydroxylysine kinase [Rhynchophorus ferrugineus]|uniref:hydroxylysine kinase n=1 Tax=Rhynchophorus ferrugineus TaxID=354439 RepID=UPI003FCE3364